MRILTLENTTFELNKIPDSVDDTIRFSVLDNSNPKEPDFFFNPLIFLESFNSPAIVLNINDKEIVMPLDWCIAVGCRDAGSDLEVLPLTSLNDRGFEAFLFNPLTGSMPDYGKIEIINFYNDVKWFFPKMKNGQLLSIPITEKDNELCAFFVKDINRQSEIIDFGKLL
jgi:hypothetical protein|tara:strand:- start:741 stop:1247 length:507 start_codon:yes stop_codon:yes gene_type:complete